MAWAKRSKSGLVVPSWAADSPAVPNLGQAIGDRLTARDLASAAAAAERRRDQAEQQRTFDLAGPGYHRKKGARGPAAGRIGRRMSLPAHTAPSRMLKAVYPWMTDPGLDVPGAYVGVDLHSFASFLFDPFELYEQDVISSPNIALVGVLGSGKSALQKCLILRLLEFGIRFSWVQLKPEYDLLAAALGVEPMRCGPGQLARFNPLAEFRRHPSQTHEAWLAANRTRRLSLVKGLISVSMGRPLTAIENSVLGWALDALTGQADPTREQLAPASLPTLHAALVNTQLWAEQARANGVDPAVAADRSMDVRLTLDQLVNGSLRGMFDSTEPRNRAFDLYAPGTLLDLSAVRDDSTLMVLAMVCAQSAMEAELMHPDAGRRIIGYDEAWKYFRAIDLVLRMVEQWKLARLYGIANMVGFHRYTDVDVAGDEGSAIRAAVRGLLADTGVKIAYRQEEDALAVTRELNGLSDVQTQLLRYLKVGCGLWKFTGDQPRSFVVKHVLSSIEKPLIDTDSRMAVIRGVDDIDDAEWEEIMDTWTSDTTVRPTGARR